MIMDSFAKLAEPVGPEQGGGGIAFFFGGDLGYVVNVLGMTSFNGFRMFSKRFQPQRCAAHRQPGWSKLAADGCR